MKMKCSSQVYFLIGLFTRHTKPACLLFLALCQCSGKTTPFFELTTEGDSETENDSDLFTDIVSDTCEIESCIPTDTNQDIVADSESETEPDTLVSSDSESVADSESEQPSEMIDTDLGSSETESISDSESDLQTVTDSESIQDADSDTDTESEENNTSDDTSACPGSCQYNPISSIDLIAIVGIENIYVDPSAESYLLCADSEGEFDLDRQTTINTFGGWIRDNNYECPLGSYCCRPQTDEDQYCVEAGGNCDRSDNPGEGPGYCIFASSECRTRGES